MVGVLDRVLNGGGGTQSRLTPTAPAQPKTTGTGTPTGAQAPQPMAAINPNPGTSPSSTQTKGISARLPGITSKSGTLGRLAMARGRQYAASRGLMNSSLGAHASHRALLDWAVPIAEKDTQTEMADKQRMAEDARQAAALAVDRERIAATTDIATKDREALDARHQKQLDSDRALQEAREAAETARQNAMILANQATQMRDLAAQDRRQATQIAAEQAMLQAKIAADNARQAAQIAADQALQNAQLRAAEIAETKRLDAARKEAIGKQFAEVQLSFDRKYTAILSNPNLSDEARDNQIRTLRASTTAQIKALEGIYGTKINFDPDNYVPAGGGGGGPGGGTGNEENAPTGGNNNQNAGGGDTVPTKIVNGVRYEQRNGQWVRSSGGGGGGPANQNIPTGPSYPSLSAWGRDMAKDFLGGYGYDRNRGGNQNNGGSPGDRNSGPSGRGGPAGGIGPSDSDRGR